MNAKNDVAMWLSAEAVILEILRCAQDHGYCAQDDELFTKYAMVFYGA